jgi:hypothetical protein
MTPMNPDPDFDNVTDFEEFKARLQANGEEAASIEERAVPAGPPWRPADYVPPKPLPLQTPPAIPAQFRIRVELADSEPPIWRELILPSHLTFDQVHEVLQAAFGWTNSHLHRFGAAGDPYGQKSQGIIMAFEIDEGEEGLLETEVRLDQLLAQPGDGLLYVYDFGDGWQHDITLLGIEPLSATDAAPHDTHEASVRCVDGSRHGPHEDVGGVNGWETYVAIVEGRAKAEYPEQLDFVSHLRFGGFRDEIDIEAINRALERMLGADAALAWLRSLGDSPLAAFFAGSDDEAQRHLAGYLAAARIDEPVEIDEAEAEAATAVYRTFLGHVGDGIRLSKAGYLPPAAVTTIMADLDPENLRYAKGNRENNIHELKRLRESMTRLGLVRKVQGELKVTKRGVQLRDAPVSLWRHVASQLPLEKAEFDRDCALLVLMLVAANEASDTLTMMESMDMLTSMVGWEAVGDSPYDRLNSLRAALPTRGVLALAGQGTLIARHVSRSERSSQPGGRLLARAALRHLAGADVAAGKSH